MIGEESVEEIAKKIKASMTEKQRAEAEPPRIRITVVFKKEEGGGNLIVMSNAFPSVNHENGLTMIRRIPKNDMETGILFIQTYMIRYIDAVVESNGAV